MQIRKVYMRLILDTLQNEEDYTSRIIKVYNNPICEIIDDYDSIACYEPYYYCKSIQGRWILLSSKNIEGSKS